MYLQLTSFPSFFFISSHFSTPVACSKGSLNPEKQYKPKLDVVSLKAEYVNNNDFFYNLLIDYLRTDFYLITQLTHNMYCSYSKVKMKYGILWLKVSYMYHKDLFLKSLHAGRR